MTNEQIAKKLGVSIEKINAIIEAGMRRAWRCAAEVELHRHG